MYKYQRQGGYVFAGIGLFVCLFVVHGSAVKSSRQITEVKQHQTQLALGWMTGVELCCQPYVEVLGKSLILCCLSILQ